MEKELQTANVTIGTSYLLKGISDNENSEENITKYGYDPNNTLDESMLLTPGERIVMLNSLKTDINSYRLDKFALSDLVIAGNTEGAESAIKMLTDGLGAGTLVARYSIFYGKPSEYTNTLPEDAGYSFDLPKDPTLVKKMLTNDYFLESIIDREEEAIIDSVNMLNKDFAKPIIITPYLAKALGQKKVRKGFRDICESATYEDYLKRMKKIK